MDKYEFGYNGQMKMNEVAGTGNWNTAEFWEYGTREAQRKNPDPVRHPNLSPYSVFNANPILNNDVKGDDWYKDNKSGNVLYDPKVQGQKDLNNNQKYIGDTYKEKTAKGSADYREDGSIMYSNETDAYNRMWNVAKLPGGGTTTHEVMGVMLKKGGILVLPDYKNDATTSETENVGYKLSNGNVFDAIAKRNVPIIGTIHTHQADFGSRGADDSPSWQDLSRFPKTTPGLPFFTMGLFGKVHGRIGTKQGATTVVPLPEGYNKVNDLLRGVKIMELLRQNKQNLEKLTE